MSVFPSEETCWSFSRYLYLLLFSLSTREFQRFVTFIIRKENIMLFCITICDWCILQLMLHTFPIPAFLITCNLVLFMKIISYSLFFKVKKRLSLILNWILFYYTRLVSSKHIVTNVQLCIAINMYMIHVTLRQTSHKYMQTIIKQTIQTNNKTKTKQKQKQKQKINKYKNMKNSQITISMIKNDNKNHHMNNNNELILLLHQLLQ